MVLILFDRYISPGCGKKYRPDSREGNTLHAYIKIKTDPSSPAMPIQYNYLVQASIYSNLPEETAARLHDQGYTASKRSFKLFSFSCLLGRFAIDKGAGTIAFPEGVLLVISSPEMKFFLSLINNLLTKSQFRRGFRREKPVTYLCGLVQRRFLKMSTRRDEKKEKKYKN